MLGGGGGCERITENVPSMLFSCYNFIDITWMGWGNLTL